MRKKQQTTEHEESHDHISYHITSHQAPAALLRAEKNIIKLGSNVCVYILYIYIYTIPIIFMGHVPPQISEPSEF